MQIFASAASAQTQENNDDNPTAAPISSQPEDDDSDVPQKQPQSDDPDAAHYGLGFRSHMVFLPRGIIKLFVDEAAGGLAQPGFGLGAIRRKENFEISAWLGYDRLNAKTGYYLEKGDDGVSTGQLPDFTEFNGLSWVTTEVNFAFHVPFSPALAFRYGAGIGLGVVLGEILRTDAKPGTCDRDNLQNTCEADFESGDQVNDPANVPPVFPVLNAFVGLQIRPARQFAINLEGGLRTVFYAGGNVEYFF